MRLRLTEVAKEICEERVAEVGFVTDATTGIEQHRSDREDQKDDG